tara:strand:- start:852 stop:2021 length:1170 start_codon:yes stop_codon:yes gene_type:complete
MTSIIKNFPVVIHQLFFLFAQLSILQIYGIGYSGILAYIGIVSTFIAVLINLRWDIEIMVSNSQEIHKSLFHASITIIIMAAVILFLNQIIGSLIPLHIVFSGIFIAVHELLVSILFVQKKIYIYSFYRTLPAITLLIFALSGFSPEIIWPLSFLISVLCLLIYFSSLFKKAFTEISFNSIQKIKLIDKFSAAIAASIFSFFSAFLVIIIDHYFGDVYVGLWSNTIRIFNSLIIFLLGAFLPFTLTTIRNQDLYEEKIKSFFYLWIFFLPLIFLSLLVVSNFGLYIFSYFESINLEVTNADLSYIFIVGVAISFIGSTQGLYQAIDRSSALLCMIILISFIGFFILYNKFLSFSSLIEIFLFITVSLSTVIIINLIYFSIYKPVNKKIN